MRVTHPRVECFNVKTYLFLYYYVVICEMSKRIHKLRVAGECSLLGFIQQKAEISRA